LIPFVTVMKHSTQAIQLHVSIVEQPQPGAVGLATTPRLCVGQSQL
jgi:hypothetical protein